MAKDNDLGKMTKAEIVENIYAKSDLDRKDILNIVDAFFDEIKNAMSQDRIVELRGFGTFQVRTRKGRDNARNPKTGEIVPVKTHGVAVFRPGKGIKSATWSLRQ